MKRDDKTVVQRLDILEKLLVGPQPVLDQRSDRIPLVVGPLAGLVRVQHGMTVHVQLWAVGERLGEELRTQHVRRGVLHAEYLRVVPQLAVLRSELLDIRLCPPLRRGVGSRRRVEAERTRTAVVPVRLEHRLEQLSLRDLCLLRLLVTVVFESERFDSRVLVE